LPVFRALPPLRIPFKPPFIFRRLNLDLLLALEFGQRAFFHCIYFYRALLWGYAAYNCNAPLRIAAFLSHFDSTRTPFAFDRPITRICHSVDGALQLIWRGTKSMRHVGTVALSS
jgi:hypothetical protein